MSTANKPFVTVVLMLAASGSASAQGTGNGLIGEYWDGLNSLLRQPIGAPNATRTGENIHFNFGPGGTFGTPTPQPPAGIQPFPAPLNADRNFVRWRGEIEAQFSETYTFTLSTDDQGSLFVNTTQVMGFGGGVRTGTLAMTAGQRVPIIVEYFENTGDARIALEWQSTSRAREIVPLNRLYSNPAVATPTITPNGGTVPATVTLATTTPGAALHYTLDGTEPGLTTPSANAILYIAPFVLQTYAKLRVRAYATGFISTEASATFSPLLDPVTPTPAGLVPGIYLRYYHNNGIWGTVTPLFDRFHPQQRAIHTPVPPSTSWDALPPTPFPRDRVDNFGLKFTGFIQAPADGTYIFETDSDDGSLLWIGPNLVVDNEGGHGTGNPQRGSINLKAGFHPITVTHYEGGGGEALSVRWQPQGAAPPTVTIPIGATGALWSDPIVATPVIAPAGGPLAAPTTVTLTCATAGATIYYTSDGSAPDARSFTGTGSSGMSFLLSVPAVVRAVAYAPGMNPSTIASVTFTAPTPATGPSLTSVTAAGVTTQVVAVFDRPVNLASAGTATNYTVNNGITVSAATPLTKDSNRRAYWRFEDNPGTPAVEAPQDDHSGNGNTLTFTGGAAADPTQVPAAIPFSTASLLLDGTDDFAQAAGSTSLDLADRSFTVALWLRTTNATSRALINQHRPNDPATGANEELGWRIDINSATGGGSTAGNVWVRLFDGTDTGESSVAAGIVNDGSWQHLAVRVDREFNRVTVFRNGVQVGAVLNFSTNVRRRMNVTARPLFLGSIQSYLGTPAVLTNERFFQGNMDDVRIYATALSNGEIAALAGGHDTFASTVSLTTSALSPTTLYTLNVSGVQDLSGAAIDPLGGVKTFQFYPSGTIAREIYQFDPNGLVIGGVRVPDLTRNASYPNNPSNGNQPTLFESPTNIFDNFGTRMRGYLIPATTGWHRIALATDDGGYLYLSPNEDPTNKSLVSFCWEWAPVRGYADPEVAQSPPIQLTAGQKYYVEMLGKEGGGGDNHAVAIIPLTGPTDPATIPNAAAPIPGAQLAPYVETLTPTQVPASRTVLAGEPVVFQVGATGNGGRAYQWRRNGVDIAGANSFRFSIANATAGDAGSYTVLISSGANQVTPPAAVLTVTALSPTLSTINPTTGPRWGSQPFTLSGTGLISPWMTIALGGTQAPGLNLTFSANGQSISGLTPAHAVGTVDVVLGYPTGQSATLAGAYMYYDVPTATSINSVAPNTDGPHGPIAGGQPLMITGTNFVAGSTTVTIGGTPGTSISVPNSTTLNVTTPAHAAGQVDVVITTPFGSVTLVNGYTYHDPPVLGAIPLESLPPFAADGANGPVAGGRAIRINAGAFTPGFITGVTSVTFGVFGVDPSTPLTTVALGAITLNTPARPAGTVPVVVRTPGGTVSTSYDYHNPPTITLVSPNAGPDAGGQAVTITGSNFVNGFTTVTFGAAPATLNTVVAGQIDLTTPAGSGAVTVTLTTPGGSAASSYTYHSPPTVTNVSPTDGPSVGGQAVIITGTNLSGTTSVTFGGTPAVVNTITTTQLTVTSPVHSAGFVVVQVVTPGGFANGGYNYHDAPTVTPPLSPNSGTTQGGQVVTISGSNFVSGQTTVSFGGALGTGVNVTGPNSLTVTTPAHAGGTVNVVVTTPGGSATATAAYTYSGPFINSVNPTSGPLAGGQTVQINGSGFQAGATVTFGTAPASITTLSPTQIIVVTPPGPGVGAVDVSVGNSGGSFTLTGGYTYLAPPTISTVTPDRGPTLGTQSVTITGTNFAPGQTAVAIGGTPASITAINGTSITISTPAHAAGLVDVSVTTFGNQTATATNAYTYIAPPTVSSIVPNRGPTTGGRTVTITGQRFVPSFTTVSFSGAAATGVSVASDGLSLTAVTPAGTGTVDVQVTTFNLQSGTLPASYTYVNPATSADLSLTMSVDNPTPFMGQNVSFLITIANAGAVAANGIQVLDLLPPGLSLVSSNASAGTYTAAAGVWDVSTLAATSGSATLTLVATVVSATSITNTAEVTALTEPDVDSTPGNGIVGEDDTVSITLQAGLTILTGATLPSGTSGALYYQAIAAAGGAPPFTWSLSSGSLPFNLNPATGAISGTAPIVGAATLFSFTLQLADSSGNGTSRTFNLTLNPANGSPPDINNLPAPPSGTFGLPYEFFFTAVDGQPLYSWSLAGGSGPLPPGLNLNASTGRLAGTPTATGTFPINLTATAQNGPVTESFSLGVNTNPVSIPAFALARASLGAAYNQSVTVTGGLGPGFTWTVFSGSLPAGLNLSGTGRRATISGTPTGTAGTSTFTLRAVDTGQTGVNATQSFFIEVMPSGGVLDITTLSLRKGTVNRPYSDTVTFTGGVGPVTWTVASGSLPAGVTLNAGSGLLSGTPTQTGVFTVIVQAATATEQDAQALSMIVAPAPTLLTADPLPPATQNQAYSITLTASGGVEPYQWILNSGSPPTGITLNGVSGTLNGIPTGSGSAFTIEVMDQNGSSTLKLFNLAVASPAGGLASIDVLPRGQVGVPFSATLQAVGGTSPYSWALLTGTLPSWATLEGATGTIRGTPTAPGTTTLTFTVTDSAAASANSGLIDLAVDSPFLITGSSLPSATVGFSYAATAPSSGGSGAVVWDVLQGSLPPGIAMDSTGMFSGTPTQVGVSSYRLQGTDGLGRVAQRQVSLAVTTLGASGIASTLGSSGKDCSFASVAADRRGPAVPALLGSVLLLLLLGRRR